MFDNIHTDGRGQVGGLALIVDFRDESIGVLGDRDFLERFPKRASILMLL